MLALKLFGSQSVTLGQESDAFSGLLTIDGVDWHYADWRLELLPKGGTTFLTVDDRNLDGLHEVLTTVRREILKQRWEFFRRNPRYHLRCWFLRVCGQRPWAHRVANRISGAYFRLSARWM